MRLPGRISAAIEILATINKQHIPISIALKNWGANHRFAGSSDRAAIGNLVYDAVRKQSLYAHLMQSDSPRALALSVIVRDWGEDIAKLNQDFAKDNFAPEQISQQERNLLEAKIDENNIPSHILANVPEWLETSIKKSFGDNFIKEGEAFAVRPPLDLRVNRLKSTSEKVIKSLQRFSPEFSKIIPEALRIKAGIKQSRTPNLLADKAYKKGWFEIQDLGSQIVASLVGAKAGEQVLDYCAGAGGKTLALAANMQNKGQIFAYDKDRNRLAPIYDRLKRNGVRNVQVIAPEDKALENLIGKMDRVIIDAPCTGTGTWRRKPEIKWKLTQQLLDERLKQQGEILKNAANYVRAGGELTYITCSILQQENAEQIKNFLKNNEDFTPIAADSLWQKKFGSTSTMRPYFDKFGLTLSPASCSTDGFYISILKRN